MRAQRDAIRRSKTKDKAIQSKKFAELQKRKERDRKRLQRAKKQNSLKEIDGRADEGIRKRRLKQQKKRDEIRYLKIKLNCEQQKRRRLDNDNLALTQQSNTPSCSKMSDNIIWSNMTPRSKKKVKLTIREQDLMRGTISQVRRNIGINLSCVPAMVSPSNTEPDMEQAIHDFMNRDDVSKICPDKKKVKNNQPTRFRLAYLSVLHEKFQAETDLHCHYSTFVRHIPKNIVKPKPSDWGTCLCMTCLNPELKVEKLTKLGYLPSTSIENIILDENKSSNLYERLAKLSAETAQHIKITYPEWRKSRDPSNGQSAFLSRKVVACSTMADLVENLLEELCTLKSHTVRV